MRPPPLLARVAVYLVVVVALLFLRFGGEWRRLLSGPKPSVSENGLVVAGSDVAPALVGQVVAEYAEAYPDIQIQVDGGGTAGALESLLEGRADVAFLLRPPTADERAAGSPDTLPCFPVALGGIVLVRGSDARFADVRVDDLRALAQGAAPSDSSRAPERLYVPDPNLGLWDALREQLGVSTAPGANALDRVVFLKNIDEVLQAVQADSRSLGVASTWTLPARADSLIVAVRPPSGEPPVRPTDVDVATGAYPLHHFLYAACLPRGRAHGAMFVTHLTSDHGQRRIERDGFLPARRVAREIYLTTHGGT